MLNVFNRIIAVLLWLSLLALIAYLLALPFHALEQAEALIGQVGDQLARWHSANATNFVIGQIAAGVVAILIFGSLLWLELWPRRRRGVRVLTREGGSVELDTNSVARRLAWHLDQLAEVIAVVPDVRARGSAVDVRLEIETAPDVDVPMKTDEVVEVTRDIIEEDMGLRLGKLDVRMHHAPFEEKWAA